MYLNPQYYGSGITDDTELVVLGLYAILLGCMLIGWLVSYVFRGIGMYGMAKKLGVPSGWMAFVPFARAYLQGQLAGTISFTKREIKNPGLWLVLVPILFFIGFIVIYLCILIPLIVMSASSPASFVYNLSSILVGFFAGLIGLIVYSVAGSALLYVLRGLVNYRICRKYKNGNTAVLHTVLSMLVPLYQSIYFFILRNRTPMSADAFVQPPALDSAPEHISQDTLAAPDEEPEQPDDFA